MPAYKKFIKYLYFLYRKWIKRDCPHFCPLCAFRHRECFQDFLNGDWFFK